jgi:hypothetical protein
MVDEAVARGEIDPGLPFLLADELADIRRRLGFHRLHRVPNPFVVSISQSLDRPGGADNSNDSPRRHEGHEGKVIWRAAPFNSRCSSS